MRKIKLIFHEILKFFLIFLLSFIWLRYFFRKLWLVTLLATILSLTIYLLLFLIGHKKKIKNGLKLKEKEDAENMFLSLACEEKPINFFEKLALKKHENVVKRKEYLLIKHKIQDSQNEKSVQMNDHVTNLKKNATKLSKKSSSKNDDESSSNQSLLNESLQNESVLNENFSNTLTKTTLLYVDLSFDGMTIPRFMEIYNKVKKEKAEKIVICCKEVTDKQLGSFLANFDEKILILDEYGTYEKLYKFYDCFPKITKKYNSEKRMVFKDFLAISFNKKRTKSYLLSAFILVICGLFVRTTIYYCIVASLLVVFALISYFNPIYNTKTESEVL